MSDLDRAVKAVVRDCLAVRAGERVLVVCDLTSRDLGERIRAEAAGAEADAVICVMTEREMDGTEPPDPVSGAIVIVRVNTRKPSRSSLPGSSMMACFPTT